MLSIILAVLALYVLQTFVPALIRYLFGEGELGHNLTDAVSGRDAPPPMPVLGARAGRALNNMQEALFVFLPLALLAVMLEASQMAVWGGLVFLVARVLYVPAYLSALPGLRTAVWAVGLSGVVLLGYSVVVASGGLW